MSVPHRAPGTVAAAARPAPERTGLALLVVVIGVMITAVDTTIVILALPEIESALRVPLASVVWVIVAYLLVLTLLATQLGRLGDMYGRARMYEAGFGIFIVGSLCCGLAWNALAIIGFRVLQGVGGALIAANSGAVIAEMVPPERRGRAYGFNAIGWNVGAIVGIVLGGLIVTYASWRWVFLINLPIGGLALGVALRVLRDRGPHRPQRIDWVGMALLGAGLLGILWAIIQLATRALDWRLGIALVGGAALLAVFLWWERRHPAPMLDLRLFAVPTLTPSLLAALFQALGNFAVLFLVIMYLQGVRHLSPLGASLLLVPGFILGGVCAPLGGRLADRVGAVVPATLGLGLQALSLLLYARLGVHSVLWLVVVASLVSGLGAAAFYPANNAAVMRVAPPRALGVASGLLRMFSNIGMIFSFSLALLVASRAIPARLAFAIFVGTTSLSAAPSAAFAAGLHAAFYASLVLVGIAAVFSLSRGRPTARAVGPAA